MSDKVGKKSKPPSPDSWRAIKASLLRWEPDQLLGLLQHLFKHVPEAKAAIVGRLLQDKPLASRQATINDLRKRICRAISPGGRSVWNVNPDVPGARRIADQYLRSTRDSDGAVLLYAEVIHSAMEIAVEFGWDDARLYDSMARVSHMAGQCAAQASDAAMLLQLRNGFRKTLEHPNFPGYGMDWTIESLVLAIEERLEALKQEVPPSDGGETW